MNKPLITALAPLAFFATAALADSSLMASADATRLDEPALDSVTAGDGASSINVSGGSGALAINSRSTGTSSTVSSSNGVSVITKTTPDGKHTDFTCTYTIKDAHGKPKTVTDHRIIPGTNVQVSVVQANGKPPQVKIGNGPAGVSIDHRLVHPLVLHKPLLPKLSPIHIVLPSLPGIAHPPGMPAK